MKFFSSRSPKETNPRFAINRCLVVLLPKQPALDWVAQGDPHSPPPTMEELRHDLDSFLLPQEGMESLEEAKRWVGNRWKQFFEYFLEDWYVDQSIWPKQRTQKMFEEWFDIQFHSMVWDFTDEPIEHDDLD